MGLSCMLSKNRQEVDLKVVKTQFAYLESFTPRGTLTAGCKMNLHKFEKSSESPEIVRK